jgi:hypothetical protein
MRRVAAVAVLSLSLAVFAGPTAAQDARQRQAAAEAYDRGTAAYLDESYEEAARWFETANRLAPAAPALMQAIRAHERHDNSARAATLALALATTYKDDASASEFARTALVKHAPTLLRVDVSCDEDCKLDLDGKLQEFLAFFVQPDTSHHLTATFETGSKSVDFDGPAGATRALEFKSPPPPPAPIATPLATESGEADRVSARPLPPLATWIGVGVTVALGAATIASGVDARAGVPGYQSAASMYTNCRRTQDTGCDGFEQKASALLKSGQSKELRTNVLIGVTAAAAVGTAVIALFLTDWSGDREQPQAALHFGVAPHPSGLTALLEGQF